MKIAMVQMEIISGAVEHNRQRGLSLAAEAAAQADVVVLPEIWTTGYALRDLGRWAEDESSLTVQRLRDLAQLHSVWIIAGSVPFARQDGIYNTTLVLGPDGSIVTQYDKAHLFSLYNEAKHFQPGRQYSVFDLPGVKAGIAICYDLRFPELFRTLALAGAGIVFVVAEWPLARAEHWRLLNQARAIENQIYVVAVNCVGQHKDIVFHGHSLLVSPDGKVLVEGGAEETIVVAELDLAAIDTTRKAMSVWQDRCTKLYTID